MEARKVANQAMLKVVILEVITLTRKDNSGMIMMKGMENTQLRLSIKDLAPQMPLVRNRI